MSQRVTGDVVTHVYPVPLLHIPTHSTASNIMNYVAACLGRKLGRQALFYAKRFRVPTTGVAWAQPVVVVAVAEHPELWARYVCQSDRSSAQQVRE